MVLVIAVLGVPTALGAARDADGLKASDPSPPDGAEGITTPLLQWTAGDTAEWHDVYFGTTVDLGPADFVMRSPRVMTIYYHAAGLTPGTTYYWRIDEIEADGTTVHTGDVWSFTTPATKAGNPYPPDGAESVDPDVDLTWTRGSRAISHDVYFGTDEAAVANGTGGTFMGNQTSTTYDPGTLAMGTTYYWRIDEFDGSQMHRGDVWSFTTVGIPQGVTYYVDGTNGSDDNDGLSRQTAFATIQKAIDSAQDAYPPAPPRRRNATVLAPPPTTPATILVYPGVYREAINFLGKAVTVRSAQDAAVLENPGDFAVSFYMGEGPGSVLENFVIRNSFMGIFIVQSSPTIKNVTVVNNTYGVEAYAQAEPDISNCIFWYNSGVDLFGCRARYSCIQRGGQGEGNIDIDPLFAGPDAGDYHLRSERGRYWPRHDIWVLDKVTSPCVDSGDPTADYADEPVPNGGRINMGAYGGTAYASMSQIECTDGDIVKRNQTPDVHITAPPDGAVFYRPATIEIEAQARDVDGFVVKVEFFANGDKIGRDTDWTDGWAFEWSDLQVGEYRLVALATDDDGAIADSTAIVIEIIETGPPPSRR